MSKTLVVYHSRSGNTRRVAQRLAEVLGADLDEIRIVHPLAGPLGYAFCAIEAILGLTPALRPARFEPDHYDCVVVGTPVWFWSVSSPVRSWLALHGPLRQRVAFFCTMGSSGAERAFASMAALCEAQPAATMALTDAQIEAGATAAIETFVHSLAASGRRRASPMHQVSRPASAATRTSRSARGKRHARATPR
ncbi:MAG: flavodoxin family protein [Betaproteobacteria bacterium]